MGPDLQEPLHLPPIEVAADTVLLRSAVPMVGAPLLLAVNSLLVDGAEPVIVDTGCAADGDRWFADLTAVVDPLAVRWVFLSHDGAGHRGSLGRTLQRCPNATLVTSWAACERMGGEWGLPPERVRWIGGDETVELGDRVLWTCRPPVYDSPATRTLFDPHSGVLWTSDTFATPMPLTPVDHIDELPLRMWAEGMAMLHHHALAPWLSTVDREAYARDVDRLRGLSPTVVVSAHAPVITGTAIDVAFEHLRSLPAVTPPPHPAARARPRTGDASGLGRRQPSPHPT